MGTRDLSPVHERSIPKQPMMNRFQMVSANATQFLNLTVDREKSLSLSH
jgi:hypothetical protein